MLPLGPRARPLLLAALLALLPLAQAQGVPPKGIQDPTQDPNADRPPTPATLPDYGIGYLYWNPHPANDEDRTQLCANVQNYGEESKQPFSVSLFFDDEEFAGKRFVEFPPTGADVCGNLTRIDRGLHRFRAVADSGNEVKEMSDENNAKSLYVPVVRKPLPDWRIHTFKITPDPVRHGETLTLAARLENVGDNSTVQTVAEFTYDGKVIARRLVPALPPKWMFDLVATLDPDRLREGTHLIGIRADAYRQMREQREDNNEETRAVIIPRLPRPDLTLEGLAFSKASNVTEGDKLNLTVRVRNVGEREAGAFAVRFLLDNATKIGEAHVPSLIPNATTTVSTQWSARPGNHTVVAYADAADALAEPDEDNNNATARLDVTPKPPELRFPDLRPERILHVPDRPTAAGPVNFTAVIKNVGRAAAGPFEVRFLLDGANHSSYRLGGLPVNASIAATASVRAGLGLHWIRIVVDSKDGVLEGNESNNGLNASFRVLEPLPPPPPRNDTPPNPSPSPAPAPRPRSPGDAPITTPSAAVAKLAVEKLEREDAADGSGSTLFYATVRNPTEAIASPFQVHFYVDGQLLGSKTVPGLRPNATTRIQSAKWVGTTGEHEVVIRVGEVNGEAAAAPEKVKQRIVLEDPSRFSVPGPGAIAGVGAALAASALARRRTRR